MSIKFKEPKPLTEQQRRFMEKTSQHVAWLLKLKPTTLQKLLDWVEMNGTDHEDGLAVDSATRDLYQLILDNQH